MFVSKEVQIEWGDEAGRAGSSEHHPAWEQGGDEVLARGPIMGNLKLPTDLRFLVVWWGAGEGGVPCTVRHRKHFSSI